MRDWASLDDRSISTFDQRGNVRQLRDLLWTGERILAVARASNPDARFRSGLLAVTNQRIVFVCERFMRRPSVVTILFETARSVNLAEEPISGALKIDTSDGSIDFRHIRPKERMWPLYWRISERIGQLPLREHS